MINTIISLEYYDVDGVGNCYIIFYLFQLIELRK